MTPRVEQAGYGSLEHGPHLALHLFQQCQPCGYIWIAVSRLERRTYREFAVLPRAIVRNGRDVLPYRIKEATITAIIEHTSGKKLQVDFGKDMTALIDTWQVVE